MIIHAGARRNREEFDDPAAYKGMERQRATEALVAAKLSRNLERPRTETDGRFARAVRLAEQDGDFRQQFNREIRSALDSVLVFRRSAAVALEI